MTLLVSLLNCQLPFQFYGETDWLNAQTDVAKPRKGWDLVTTLFIFKHGVVFLCQEKLKGKVKKYKVSLELSNLGQL